MNEMLKGPTPGQAGSASGTVSFAVLDQALWQKFRNAAGPEEFVEAWLALLCRQVPGVVAGVAVLGEPDVGPFTPVAWWPDKDVVGVSLSAIAEKSLVQRQGAVTSGLGSDGAQAVRQIAQPLIVDGRIYGVCAVSSVGDEIGAGETLRRMQWAAGWMEVLLRRQMQADDQEARERSRIAFDMLATVLDNNSITAASTALVTELALRLDCDPVSVGFVRHRRCSVAAVSHAADFSKKINLIKDIAAAMDEAVDQRSIVLHPAREGWEYRVSREHEELAREHKTGGVLTVPLQFDHRSIGAITFIKPAGREFDEAEIDLCDAVAAVVGPVLEEKRRNDRNILVKIWEASARQAERLLGPRYFGRKLATLCFAAAAVWLSLATTDHAVTSPAIVRGTIQRTIVAPFNGYVASENVRAGETVKKGDTLAQLDDQDLSFERLRLSTSRQQRMTEYDRALAKYDRAEAAIIKTQIEQAEAQLKLIDEQLRRTRLVAPFDGFVVQGDLSQSIGAAVERGQELFRIAPLDTYRVVIDVDESDIGDIALDQAGVLRVASLPQESMSYRIERITALSMQKDGRNFFQVEAALDHPSPRLRPGMEGIAKTAIDRRLLVTSYAGKMLDWAYLVLWRWLP
ncbi:RND family efflux transporter MFP subunit [Mesorhizobium shonense]|uniref:RND family efflux transporter MFP subunit n=1 Tax=Mesorhizobium shonense TaxID=1209948 RepID=A0ABV2HRI2_9HYPH|nr:efflux RND transporter periplasmic adaptor subunit [Mesorhizobium sp.]TIS50025.1 MAG: efflux RND transporter periplasmic adaptor subunit [Mesorhizobium sp.]